MCKQMGGPKKTGVKAEDVGGSAQGAMLLRPTWGVGSGGKHSFPSLCERKLLCRLPLYRCYPTEEWVMGTRPPWIVNGVKE